MCNLAVATKTAFTIHTFQQQQPCSEIEPHSFPLPAYFGVSLQSYQRSQKSFGTKLFQKSQKSKFFDKTKSSGNSEDADIFKARRTLD